MSEADPAFIKVVPCGNISNWSKLDEKEVWYEKGHSKISQIFITFEETITSLQFQYVDDEGKMVLSKVHGFNGNGVTSNNFALVTLNHEREFITGLSGGEDDYGYVNSITIHTNENKYGPFGWSCRSSDYQRICVKIARVKFFVENHLKGPNFIAVSE
ncbi:jacalin-related lectin 24-like [Spinacia oleracea]|uniref:Jacalin-related lectin 24-like n=1 Tax=Spinacia oleracea TaxID=3562 RepID=A0ABM3RGS0_SPIOL|nr:jacalin-related lectin 24-like [Spinacia oleracea]